MRLSRAVVQHETAPRWLSGLGHKCGDVLGTFPFHGSDVGGRRFDEYPTIFLAEICTEVAKVAREKVRRMRGERGHKGRAIIFGELNWTREIQRRRFGHRNMLQQLVERGDLLGVNEVTARLCDNLGRR